MSKKNRQHGSTPKQSSGSQGAAAPTSVPPTEKLVVHQDPGPSTQGVVEMPGLQKHVMFPVEGPEKHDGTLETPQEPLQEPEAAPEPPPAVQAAPKAPAAPAEPLEDVLKEIEASAPQPSRRAMLLAHLQQHPDLVEATVSNILQIECPIRRAYIQAKVAEDEDRLGCFPGIWMLGWQGPKPSPVPRICEGCGKKYEMLDVLIENGVVVEDFHCPECRVKNARPPIALKTDGWKVKQFHRIKATPTEAEVICGNCSKAFIASAVDQTNMDRHPASGLGVCRCPRCGATEEVVQG